GWATWRRVWRRYDYAMFDLPGKFEAGVFEDIFEAANVRNYWTNCFAGTYLRRIDTWDYQFALTLFENNHLTIVSGVNLISNIGCAREDATHIVMDSPYANLPRGQLTFPLDHPSHVAACRRVDVVDETFGFGIPSASQA
ncbi:MAG: hypothetical protein K2Q10_09785, partial [Rhodospirillales bacterium]|nr:hypothetical protein [Rhodospirillales bacterium]